MPISLLEKYNSSLGRRDIPELFEPCLVFFKLDRFEHPLLGRRVFVQKPVWPNWSPNQAATTVWAHVVQHRINTVHTKRAFKGADHGVNRIWGKVPVTVFAVGSKFKHIELRMKNEE